MAQILSFVPLVVLVSALVLFPTENIFAQTTTDGSTCITPLAVFPNDEGGFSCVTTDGALKPMANPSDTDTETAISIDPSKTLGCKVTNDIPAGVASFDPLETPYVPVSDRAVTRNTAYLVYKECILDPVANKMRQAAIAQLIASSTALINEGDNGNPLFVTNLAEDRAQIAARVLSEFADPAKKNPVASLCGTEEQKEEIRKAVVRSILAQSSEERRPGACTFDGEDDQYDKFLSGDFTGGGGWKTLWNFAKNPSNAPLFAFTRKKAEVEAQIAEMQADRAALLQMGSGFAPREIPVEVPAANGETRKIWRIGTPGIAYSNILKNVIESPIDQLEMADEMDKVIDGGLSTLTLKILSDPKGLANISKPGSAQNPRPGSESKSFLEQLLESVLNLIQQTATPPTQPPQGGSALVALTAALQNEQQFMSHRNTVLTYLGTVSKKIVDEQNACWVKLEQAVRAQSNNAFIVVATSSVYANTAIADVVTPIEIPIKTEVNVASTSIAALLGHIASVSTSNTPETNAAAFTALAQMRSDKRLHSTAETVVAQQNITDIKSAVDIRLNATMVAWKQGSGWCNASSTAVVQSWFNQWRQ